MESVISKMVAEWGSIGVLLVAVIYIIWNNYKESKNSNGRLGEATALMRGLDGKIDNLHEKIELVDTKVDEFKSQLDNKIELVEDKIENMPPTYMNHLDVRAGEKHKAHLKQLDDLMKLGPKLHRIIQEANTKIGSDHIFVGSFHNGNSSLSGIPYYKFDIIAERFSPVKVDRDCEFAFMYKDSDILRYDSLPVLLEQHGMIYFNIPEEGDSEIMKYDDIIWRRMRGRGIKQIALRLTRDIKNTPSGFVGVVKYNMDELNLQCLDDCGKYLEEIYREAETKQQK